MKEKIKKIIKPFLAVIIAGFVISFLYISLVNRETKEIIRLPEISGYDYSDLESMIYDLEWRIDDLESQISDLEWRIDDLESRTSDLEGQIDDLDWRIYDLEWNQ